MTITFIAATKAASQSNATTPAIDTTGANFLVLMVSSGTNTLTISDSKGNTYTALTGSGSAPKAQIYYCANATVGTGHTFSITGTSIACSFVAAAYAGVVTSSPVDTQHIGNVTATNVATFAITKTPTVDGCLVINGVAGGTAWTAYAAASGWSLADSQSYVGGVNYGSGLEYKIQTTATQILSTEQTATWTTNTSGLTPSAIFKPLVGGGGAITLTDVVTYRVVQRSGTSGSLLIAGTHTGATSVQARIVLDGTSTEVVTWTTIDAAPGASSFSGTLTGIPQGAWYNIQVRQGNDTSITSNGTNKFGVGCLFGIIGQSQGVHWITDGTSITPNTYLVQYTGTAGTAWAARTTTGNGANAFGNAMRTALGGTIPVAILYYGIGSTALDVLATTGSGYWMNLAGGQPYPGFKNGVNSVGGKLEAAIWMQGEQDGATGLVSEALYQSDLETLFARIRTDFSQASLPLIVSPLARDTLGPVDADWEGIRQAQITVGKQTNNTLAAPNQDIPLVDGVHYTAAGYTTHGTRAAVACAYALGLGSYPRGPVIASATLPTTTTVEVTLTHRGGTDFTPTSGITGFQIFDSGVARTITSAVRTSATKILLTVSAEITGTGTLRYQYGVNPVVTAPALDNTAQTLPIGLESGATMTITAGNLVKCTILTTGGVIRQILDAELGTGKKPLVLDGNRWRQRQAAEGTAIVYVNSRYRLLAAGEELQV